MPALTVTLPKGGVGKTTIATNLADRLANTGASTVVVDADQQGNATNALGCREAYQADVFLEDVLDDETDVEVHDVLRSADGDTDLEVVPSHEDLDDVADAIEDDPFGVLLLRRHVVEPLLETLDWVVIDAPPQIGPLSDAAIVAGRNLVVPLEMAEPSVDGFERMASQQIKPLQAELDIEIVAIVPNPLSGDSEERRIIEDLESVDQ